MSSTVLDRPSCAVETPPAMDLLVLWQHPETREIIPIGRFTYDGDAYDFGYTRAVERVGGFRPLPGLPELDRRYVTQTMPAVFNQRIMSVERPDYTTYLGHLGLPAEAGPWEQIVESGGGRAGDTLQFMEIPRVVQGRAIARFLANGVRHIPTHPASLPGRTIRVDLADHEAALQNLQPGSPVLLEPELENPADPNAVLLTAQGTPIGWVPRVLAASCRALMEGNTLFATVHRAATASAPSHVRLSLDLNVPAPTGFSFDRAGEWERLAAQ